MTKAFLVYKDCLDNKAVQVFGPRGITREEIKRLNAGKGEPFRLLDDDQVVYYLGRFLGDKNSEAAFAPLDCYGAPNAGCTGIQYRYRGEWGYL